MLHKLALSRSSDNNDQPKVHQAPAEAMAAAGTDQEEDVKQQDKTFPDFKNRLSNVVYDDDVRSEVYNAGLTHEKRRKIQKVLG